MAVVQIKKKTVFDRTFLNRYDRLHNDYLWILTNTDKLRATYPNKYVAVENRTVKFSSGSIGEIMAEIKASNQQVDDFAIEFIGKRPVDFLL
jgi:hypothetical protein